jgi:hypothetical protein
MAENPKDYCAWPKVDNSQMVNNFPMLNFEEGVKEMKVML